MATGYLRTVWQKKKNIYKKTIKREKKKWVKNN